MDGEEVLVESLRLDDDENVEDDDEDDDVPRAAATAAGRLPLSERMGAVHALATVAGASPSTQQQSRAPSLVCLIVHHPNHHR